MIRTVLVALLIILVVIQFIRPEKNQSVGAQPAYIATKYEVPEQVHALLKRSCFDCHSNNTVYPWYDRIQPVSWWLNHHVQEGKSELNFDEFATYSPKKAKHKLEEVAESVTDGWMPLNSYLWIHHDAKLTPDEAKLIAGWANGLEKQIQVPAGEESEHEHHKEN